MAGRTEATGDTGQAAAGTSVDPEEVARFAAVAESWWDVDGPFRPLHRLNPTRLRWLRDRLAAHFGRDPVARQPLAGLRILDIGCGGGLVAEPLARLGATVTGIDATADNVSVARVHAARSGLDIDYRHVAVETLAEAGEQFDAVLALEVIEHVTDPASFVTAAASVLRPGGCLALSTLNRTPKSYLLAILGAEYVLRWLPRGTHDWRRFLRPSETARFLRRAGLVLQRAEGLHYAPLTRHWRVTRDLDVNYLMFAVRPAVESRGA